MTLIPLQKEFFEQISEPLICEPLFDNLSDLVFFIKNEHGQYVMVNHALARRCGKSEKAELIGKWPDEVYPSPLGAEYRSQDQHILEGGKPILNQLEMQISSSLDLCWCITTKVPLRNAQGKIMGLAGISRDLEMQGSKNKDLEGIAETISYIKKNYNKPLLIDELAKKANLSSYQYEQRMQKIFKITAGQFIQKTRIEMALWQLRESDMTILDIALDCGYADQSAFSRQFKKTIGLSPAQYRKIITK